MDEETGWASTHPKPLHHQQASSSLQSISGLLSLAA